LPAGIFFRREFDTLGHSLLHMEGESHRVYKAVLGQPFAALAAKRLTAKTLVPVADSIIDDFGARRYFQAVIACPIILKKGISPEGTVGALKSTMSEPGEYFVQES
jgi:hypothetical protein